VIISISRRTDIPALYTPWLMNRLREGYALVPHPRNPKKLSRVQLSPDVVDCFVFWSKNPGPLMEHLRELEVWGTPFYFTFTLTPYGNELEPGLPPKEKLLDTFQRLSEAVGPHRVDWRYDPVVLDPAHPVSYHLDRFSEYSEKLHSYTTRCIFSFLDPYAHLHGRFLPPNPEQMRQIAAGFSHIAASFRLPLLTCCEKVDLSPWGIRHGACIDPQKIQELLGRPVRTKKDAGQRESCGCAQSVDIGTYDTCTAGCAYCYATHRPSYALVRAKAHNAASPLLTGWPEQDQQITDRDMRSLVSEQLRLY
jgi:hypothetical protein